MIRIQSAVAVCVLAALAADLSGCSSGSPGGFPGTATTTPRSPVPQAPAGQTITAAATPATPPRRDLDVRVYFMRGGLIGVAHRHVPPTQQVAAAAMVQLLAGPTTEDIAAGLRSAVPQGTRLLGVTLTDGTATVDLSGDFAGGTGSAPMTSRVAQVTYTLTQFPTVRRVDLHINGDRQVLRGGDDARLGLPMTRASFESLTPAILIETPGPASVVGSPVRVAGTANVFEAQLTAEITDGGGRVLGVQAVQAFAGTGSRGSFDVRVPYPASRGGPATLTVFDRSPKDGPRLDVVEIPLQLTSST